MWVEHYSKGEVPVTERIKTREDWVTEETVRLTNILNKLVSMDEEIRSQGLTEVADIIPFFILGNMNLQEIATYLKGKLAAAQEVSTMLEKEKSIKEKLIKNSEEFVDLDKKTESKPQEQMLERTLEPEAPKTVSSDVPTENTPTSEVTDENANS
jgi:hypothetical protein